MTSLYLHIPFCEKKCMYCDFYSVESLSTVAGFLSALRRELCLYASYSRGGNAVTVYFGGGTPSLLTADQLGGVMSEVRSSFAVDVDAEITLEVNPGTASVEKLRAYRTLGVNRLSIGIQSFNDAELKFLERIHDSTQAARCVEDARRAGFDNISVDLIYALPGQTHEQWETTLRAALDLQPEHISAYSLIVEDGTPLARMVRRGVVRPESVETEAAMYETTMAFLAGNGYEHYEVSNYARPGYRSRHNSAYWSHQNYLGFGPSAHSFWMEPDRRRGRRWSNIANILTYCRRLEEHQAPVDFEETVVERGLVNERIFLGLRAGGLDLRALRNEYGVDLASARRAIVDGLLERHSAVLDGGLLRLTPKGFLLCDEIAGRMML